MLQLADADAAEQELIDAAPALGPDELATCVAKLAPHLPPDRREHWVGRALARAADGRTVLERLAPHLGPDDARTYLERLIVPEEPRQHELSFASADEEAPTAAALARRMGELGAADTAYALLRLGRDDGITLCGLVEVAAYLARDDVLDIEERLLSTRVRYLIVVDDGSRLGNIPPSFLGGTLAPALARVGEVRRALRHADGTDAEPRRVDAYLGIAERTHGETRSEVLTTAVATVLDLRDVFRREQVGRVGKAVARDAAAAAAAWPTALQWASEHPCDEAIGLLAAFAPVAAAVGGSARVDETFDAVERVLHWWP